MKELRLKFKDETGAIKSVLVESQKFIVGRTSDNDLSIPIQNLSREHLQIDRFGDVFIVSDLNSSNGTKLNDKDLIKPSELKTGDKLNLGDVIEIEAEISPNVSAISASNTEVSSETASNSAASVSTVQTASISSENSFPLGLMILAPILGIVILAVAGTIIYLVGDTPNTVVANKNDDYVSLKNNKTTAVDNDEDTDDDGNKKTTSTPKPDKTSTPVSVSETPVGSDSPTPEPVSTPKPAGDTDKVDRASVIFLRKISVNGSNAFLTEKQISIVAPIVNQFKNSSALADNLKNAKTNASQIQSLASSKNLRPQFLVAAALAKLGNRSGNVLQTAQSMSEILSTLRTTIGDEFPDDVLLIIAAYEQGEAGKTLAMRDTVANLTNKFPNVSSRTVRSIWFLRENGKVSDSEFNFALKFLAIGIIMQNPKAFNVQSEAVNFD